MYPMSNSSASSSSPKSSSRLLKWINQTTSGPEMRVGYRLRGNTLHLLYEGSSCPNQQIMIRNVLSSLKSTDISAYLPESVEVYQIWLYGRKRRTETEDTSFSKKLDWTFRINLDQVEQLHLQIQSPTASETASEFSTPPEQRASPVSSTPNRYGSAAPSADATTPAPLNVAHLESIARQLSATLNHLGVSVNVAAKAQANLAPSQPVVTASGMTSVSFPQLHNAATHRLWISCRARHSPSPSLIAEPIARQLRLLNLEGFRDAVVTVRVIGEEKPDWILRIDLTPTDVLLREWAQWGDVAALSRLINEALSAGGWALATATLKESTLHLVCQHENGEASGQSLHQDSIWSVDQLKSSVQNTLDELAPQGIHAAVLYGQQPQAQAPDWVEWLSLPASNDVDHSIDALSLAQHGQLEAIAFLMSRLLNPDLNTQVATGGIRIQLLPKDGLMHVMCDAPICPPQESICDKVVRLLRQLNVSEITGVRIYGRRSGRRSPLWSYGTDFVARQRFVPEPEPEFAASDAYVNELITHQDASPLRPDLTSAELQARWTRFNQRVGQVIQRSLLKSQFVTPTPETPTLSLPQTINRQGIKAAVIWSVVGLLSVVQIDWVMGWMAQSATEAEARQNELVEPPPAVVPNLEVAGEGSDSEDLSDAEDSLEAASSENIAPADLEQNDLSSDEDLNEDDEPFQTDEFIRSASDAESSPSGSPDPSVLSISQVEGSREASQSDSSQQELLIDQSPYPSFNSSQLDLKLALYHQRVAEQGVPDVMVIGSSRALRGIDPEVLERALFNQGYADADVFNFGINGATAQVVELVVQRILVPEQLPQVIVWADGARAFNGGREDRTYDSMAASEGYTLLSEGQLSVPITTPNGVIRAGSGSGEQTGSSSWTVAFSASLTDSYQALDEWLSDRLAHVSLAHDERDRLKSMIQDTITVDLSRNTGSNRGSNVSSANGKPTGTAGDEANFEGDRILGQIDPDGFLPLDVRFDPVTYYESFSRVAGNYDKDYADFRLSGSQSESLQSILALSQNHDVPIVFVNLPLTEEYLDPYRMAHEAEFRQFMLEVDLSNDQFVFRDLGALWLDQEDYYGYFSDPSHLNRYGAFEVSKRLAQDAMIPWPGSSSRL